MGLCLPTTLDRSGAEGPAPAAVRHDLRQLVGQAAAPPLRAAALGRFLCLHPGTAGGHLLHPACKKVSRRSILIRYQSAWVVLLGFPWRAAAPGGFLRLHPWPPGRHSLRFVKSELQQVSIASSDGALLLYWTASSTSHATAAFSAAASAVAPLTMHHVVNLQQPAFRAAFNLPSPKELQVVAPLSAWFPDVYAWEWKKYPAGAWEHDVLHQEIYRSVGAWHASGMRPFSGAAGQKFACRPASQPVKVKSFYTPARA
eukprot:1100409-Pelagomonas_calceolata.AAC.10